MTDDTGEVNSYPNQCYWTTYNNPGIGGYGAAVRLGDVDGDGLDDYLSVTNVDGGVLAYLNGGQQGNSWSWIEQANGNQIALGYNGANRSDIHFADINGQ